MAVVKYGGGILDIRGSIGGQVHSKNRYGSYIRKKTVPVNPRSSAQNAVRAAMAAVTARWSAVLTQLQRDAWEVYAAAITVVNKLGESITLTGFNHFVRSNVARRNADQTFLNVAPVDLTLPGGDDSFAIVASSGAQTISVAYNDAQAWVSEDSGMLVVHQALPQNGSRAFFDGHFRKIGSVQGDSGSPPSSPQTINVTFPIAVDQRQWVKARILRADGRLSSFFRDDSLVVA